MGFLRSSWPECADGIENHWPRQTAQFCHSAASQRALVCQIAPTQPPWTSASPPWRHFSVPWELWHFTLPNQLNWNVWGKAQAAVVFTAPQLIPMCSQDWEPLLHSFPPATDTTTKWLSDKVTFSPTLTGRRGPPGWLDIHAPRRETVRVLYLRTQWETIISLLLCLPDLFISLFWGRNPAFAIWMGPPELHLSISSFHGWFNVWKHFLYKENMKTDRLFGKRLKTASVKWTQILGDSTRQRTPEPAERSLWPVTSSQVLVEVAILAVVVHSSPQKPRGSLPSPLPGQQDVVQSSEMASLPAPAHHPASV